MRRLPLLALPLLLALSSTAFADKGKDFSWMSVGVIGGTMDVGDRYMGGVGALVTAGHSFGPIHVQGEYSLMFLHAAEGGEAATILGHQHRLGALGRWAWWDLSGRFGRMDLGVEAGLGRSITDWGGTGTLERTDYVLGVSSQMLFNLTGSSDRRRMFGMTMGMRVVAAEAPDSYTAYTTCAGPCTDPGRSSPYDLGLLMYWGLSYLR